MTWEALYQVIVIGTKAQISGTATVTSAALRADSAEVQLVAGAIRKTREAPAPAPAFFFRGRVAAADSVSAVAGEQAGGATHVYQLPRPLPIEPGTPVRTA